MNRRLNLIFLKRWFMLLIIVAVAAMPLHAFAAEAESGAISHG
ncbi:hypothetical protein P9222_33020 [Paenibacillus amylolyticus]|nr:hypothetical protein [Paenibacillus amylolyticus]WFR62866.1 hypothetical protein P9222_33020 [Paenibacillus amylolyticus]